MAIAARPIALAAVAIGARLARPLAMRCSVVRLLGGRHLRGAGAE